ncbi:MAG: hypothetical protein HFJ80_04725 [Clostridiales bacterium]|nr:hypothetical protein [Clostridiales bacterium]
MARVEGGRLTSRRELERESLRRRLGRSFLFTGSRLKGELTHRSVRTGQQTPPAVSASGGATPMYWGLVADDYQRL